MILDLPGDGHAPRIRPARAVTPAGLRHRIIVADDDEHMRTETLKLLGSDYDIAAVVVDGVQLHAGACRLKPHLILADIAMPGMSGLEAVRLIRLEGVDSKIIFFTTNGNPLYVRKAFSLGATGYVLKALGIEELPAAIRIVLHGGRFVSPSIGFPA